MKTNYYIDFQKTLPFNLYVVLIGQGRRFHSKLSEVFLMNNKKMFDVILSKFKFFQGQ